MHNNIYRVDLDLTGLCNKRCSFCPRADDSYPNENKHMSFEVIREVMDELRSIDYSGWIELAGRGESTLHPQFLEVVDMLSKDKWKLRLTTNGYRIDRWWNTETAKKLDEVILNTYTTKEEYQERIRDYAFLPNGKALEQYYKPDGLSIEEMNNLPGFILPNSGEERPITWAYNFNNRAGFFNNKVRNAPCWHPMRQIFIDYNGFYQMCCNDWTYQVKIGHVLERSLMDMYANDPKMNRVRWSLLNGRRDDVKPCSMCDDSQGANPKSKKTIDNFKQTDEYKFIVTKIAGEEGLAYRESLKSGNNI